MDDDVDSNLSNCVAELEFELTFLASESYQEELLLAGGRWTRKSRRVEKALEDILADLKALKRDMASGFDLSTAHTLGGSVGREARSMQSELSYNARAAMLQSVCTYYLTKSNDLRLKVHE